MVDDAFITFRYSENLAAGHGLVFNPGEPAVLGTSTPLMALVLGLLKALGADVPTASRIIGLVSVVGVIVISQRIASRVLGHWGAAAVAMCLAMHFGLGFVANSGMETGLSMIAVYGALWLTLRGNYLPAGLVGGLAFLLRPDGALVVLLAAGLALLRKPRRIWQPLLAALIVISPWLIYAYLTYGGILPNSIQAKRLIHPDTPLNIFVSYMSQHFVYGLGMKILSGFAIVGLITAVIRKSELLLVGLWMALYLAGLSASRIAAVFPWYMAPLLPGLVMLAGCGIDGLAGMSSKLFATPATPTRWKQFRAASMLLLIVAAFCFRDGVLNPPKHEGHYGPRVGAYLSIGKILRQYAEPGDAVLVWEVGALGYALPEQLILDSSGINSPEIHRIRKADRERSQGLGITNPHRMGTPVWVRETIDRFNPRYIITDAKFLHIQSIMRDPRVMRRYHRLPLDIPNGGAYVVLERR